MSKRTIIIGAGHAGGQCATSLRQAKYEGEILLMGAESYPPYERPPLSKQMLVVGLEAEKLYLRKKEYYQKSNIQLKLGVTIARVDVGIRQVFLANGEYLDYDHLVLATGGRVRKLAIPGAELRGVHYLRTIDDATNILAELREEGLNVVVIGGGYIGLEAAASLRKRNCEVSLLEATDRLMGRSVGAEISTFYQAYHQSQGVKIQLETKAVRIRGEKSVEAVECEDGSVHPADLVIIGIGIIPNTALAEEAALLVDQGIIVNEYCQSSDTYIYAIGDVANHPSSLYGRRIRLESVQNAVGQARVVAKAIVGKPIPYTEVPWFWSDQYDLKLQLAGLPENYDHILIRGDQAEGKFALWYLNGNQVQAVHAVNLPRDFMFGKQFIARRLELEVDKLRDIEMPLKEL